MKNYLEILGNLLVIFLGGLLIYIFLTIEVWGIYGVEANVYIRRFEIFAGFPIIAVGVYNLIKDLKR